MHGLLQLAGKRGVHAALALYPAFAFKSRRHDPDVKMGFAPAAIGARGARMAGMAMAFIHHIQRNRRKAGGQFFPDDIGDRHWTNISP